MAAKNWTISEKIFLYKFVLENGTIWTDVAETLGCTTEAARSKYRHTNWQNLFKEYKIDEKRIALFTNKDIERLETKYIQKREHSIEEETVKAVELQKEKIVKEAEGRRQSEFLKQYATAELIIDKIVAAVEAVPQIKISDIKSPPTIKYETKPQHANLVLSDIHIGCAVKADEVGGFSEYNTQIFKRRLWNLVDKVIKVTGHHRRTCQIDTLNIFNLGDNVHGSNDSGQWGFLHTEQNIVDQIFILWAELEKAILTLSKCFKNIEFFGIYGNHGRVAHKGVEKRFVNWDYILYKILEKALSHQPNIKFHVPRSPFQVANVLGNKFLLIHGDQVRGWGGLPIYGMVRAESRYRNLFDRSKRIETLWQDIEANGLDKKDPKEMLKFAFEYCKTFDYMIMGHYHQMVEFESSAGGRVMMNASFFGGDDYAINEILTASTPSQKFFGVHPEGRSWSYDIDLDRV